MLTCTRVTHPRLLSQTFTVIPGVALGEEIGRSIHPEDGFPMFTDQASSLNATAAWMRFLKAASSTVSAS